MLNLNDLYLRLPPMLQNLALDLKGLQERHVRFAGEYATERANARRRRGFTRAQLDAVTLERVNRMLHLAAAGTRFYPRFWGSAARDSVRTLGELGELPVLDKQSVRASNDDLRCVTVASKLVLQTTGTTGTPLRVFSTKRARQRNYAFFDDFLEASRIDPRSRRAVLGGRVVVHADSTGPYWRTSSTTRTTYFSSYHISPRTIAEYAGALASSRVEYIEAYPSAIGEIAQLMRERGLSHPARIPVVTSGETLRPEQEQAIREVFGGPVFDQYGSAEMCVFAERCAAGRYHVRPEFGFVEVLTDAGAHAGPGEEGRIVCTGLINEGMPLVRYDMGDRVVVAAAICPCGWDTPTWDVILGRNDDVVRTRGGRAIGRLSPVLKGFPILESQYVQAAIGELLVRVVPAPGFSDATPEEIKKAVADRVGIDMTIVVQCVDSIPQGPGGKRRQVISTVAGAVQRAE